MITIQFSVGLLPVDISAKFIEEYFKERGIKVFAIPSDIYCLESEDESVKDMLEDCHDQLVEFLICLDLPAQQFKKPEVKPETIFLPKASKIIIPNEQDLKTDFSKLPGGIEKHLGSKARKHYKMKE